MDAAHQVREAAEARAAALAKGDANGLLELLHEGFRWTSHLGESFNRQEYVSRNTGGSTTWQSQVIRNAEVTVVGDVAVLTAEVTDVVGSGENAETFRMPVTQVWVRQSERWQCLAGHAGPRRS